MSRNQQDTPNIIPNPTRYDGHFLYKFNEQDRAFSLGGIAVNKREALVRLGVMPDNNVLTNKVINQLGSRVLDMLRNAPDASALKEKHDLTMQTFADEVELICNWAMIDVLSALKPLERLTSIGSFSAVSLLGPDGSVVMPIKGIKLQLPESLDTELKEAIEEKFKAIKTNIENKLSDRKLIDNFERKNGEELQLFQRDLLRNILQDFAKIQSFISLEQRSAGELLSIANATATGAVQNALYAVQNHVYSAHACTDAQLWIAEKSGARQQGSGSAAAAAAAAANGAAAPARAGSDDQLAGDSFVLDTAQFDGMQQEDALFAACLLEAGENNPNAAKENARENIRNKHLALKNNVDEIRARDPNEFYIPTRLGIGRDAYWQDHMASAANNERFLAQYKKAVGESALITSPVAAFIYEPGDILSAAGNFAIAFGEYFSKELAAKHPVMTTGAFAMPSVYLTTVAFANAGIAPHLMHTIYTTMGKLLSGDAHFIDPQKLTEAAAAVNKAWFWVTKTHGTMQTLIMTGFAEPKLLYFTTERLVDEMISGSHQTTFAALEKILSSGAIDTNTSQDDIRNKAKIILTGVILLGVACGLGIGAAALPHHVPVLSQVQKTMEIFDNVSIADFTSLVDASGMAAHAEAFAQLFGVAQTAGFFVAKIAGVRYFMKENLSQDDLEAFGYFIRLQDSQAPQTDKHDHYKSLVQAHIQKHPELIKIAGFSDQFLQTHALAKPQEPSLSSRVLAGTKNIASGAFGILRGIGVFAYQSVLTIVAMPLKLIVGALSTLGAIIGAFIGVDFNYRAGWDAISKLQRRVTIEHRDSVMDGLKVRLALTKFAAMAFYMPKFFIQALYGTGVRLISGAIGVVSGIATTVVGLVERRKSLRELGLFLGAQTLKASTLIVRPLQFVGKVVLSVFIGVGAFFDSLRKNFRTSEGTGIWSDTKKTFKDARAALLPNPVQWIKNKIIDLNSKQDVKYNMQDSPTIKTKAFFASINRGFLSAALKVKDTVGAGLAWLRDKIMRKPQEELQQLHRDMQRDAASAALKEFQTASVAAKPEEKQEWVFLPSDQDNKDDNLTPPVSPRQSAASTASPSESAGSVKSSVSDVLGAMLFFNPTNRNKPADQPSLQEQQQREEKDQRKPGL